MKLLLATRNEHKLREIARMLAGCPLDLVSLREFPEIAEVAEDGRTLEENASKKAKLPAASSGLWSLADDTGLEVEALGGAPGVFSARYAGPGCDYRENNDKLLRELRGVELPRRRAVFRCVMALAAPSGQLCLREGRLEGLIAERPAGAQGFGYDPLFLLPELGKTLAELAPDEKNSLSHRSRALAAVRRDLEALCARA